MIGPTLQCGHNAPIRERHRAGPEAWCETCAAWIPKLTLDDDPAQPATRVWGGVAVNMNDRRFSGAA